MLIYDGQVHVGQQIGHRLIAPVTICKTSVARILGNILYRIRKATI